MSPEQKAQVLGRVCGCQKQLQLLLLEGAAKGRGVSMWGESELRRVQCLIVTAMYLVHMDGPTLGIVLPAEHSKVSLVSIGNQPPPESCFIEEAKAHSLRISQGSGSLKETVWFLSSLRLPQCPPSLNQLWFQSL